MPRSYTKDSIQYLDDDELAGLFRVIDSPRGSRPRDLAIFEVAYHRGLRASEVGLLLLSDVNLAKRMIHVRRLKGSISGDYRLTRRELRALESWIAVRGHTSGPLFPSRNRRAIGRRQLHNLMVEYASAADLPEHKRHFHCLRHTSGTDLAELVEDPVMVQDHLGHVSINSTMKYLKVRPKRRMDLGERIADKW